MTSTPGSRSIKTSGRITGEDGPVVLHTWADGSALMPSEYRS
jgi:hypothetical protein